jgi:hypothetical protein
MSVAGSPRIASTPGYSGKPLWSKLGLRPGLRVRLQGEPDDYWQLCAFDAASVTRVSPRATFDFGHIFITSKVALTRALVAASQKLEPAGMLWVSWPKKSSGVTTDVTEDTLREVALPLGLVDVKVCAVTEVWSGLKLMWRHSARSALAPGKAGSRRKQT